MAVTSLRQRGTTCQLPPFCPWPTQSPVDTQGECCQLQGSTQTSLDDSTTPVTKTLTTHIQTLAHKDSDTDD